MFVHSSNYSLKPKELKLKSYLKKRLSKNKLNWKKKPSPHSRLSKRKRRRFVKRKLRKLAKLQLVKLLQRKVQKMKSRNSMFQSYRSPK
jgi:hypothetical protein